MQFSLSTLAFVAISGFAVAQVEQSAPFNLTITSDDGKYTNTPLNACHEGAAIESLCVDGYGATFQLNTTDGLTTGILTYELEASRPFSEALGFYNDFSTNVGLAQFGALTPASVGFDDAEKMNIGTVYNDKVTPPTDQTVAIYYNWYACVTNYMGYVHTTVNWVYGDYPPQNPSCVAVNVTREFL